MPGNTKRLGGQDNMFRSRLKADVFHILSPARHGAYFIHYIENLPELVSKIH